MNLLINGLVTGAVFAIAASGLVVTYSTSGVFNFAHGALGMLSAYVYWDLRVNDSHTWPLLPKGVWPAPLALGFVLLIFAPLLGALLYRFVIRGLQETSEIVKLVVPISVLLAAIVLANWVWKPTDSHSIQPFFGAANRITVFGVVLLWHDIVILLVAVWLAIGLRVLLYRSRVGVSMRAVVDDRPLLELNGARPDRVSLVSWMLGVSLSALAGILITPFEGGSLSVTLLTLLVINAFAATMFGRLRNLPLTFLGAIVLGFATRMAFERPTGLMPKSFDWGGNFRLAVPMILLLIVLLVLPQDRLRGAVAYRTRERFALPTMNSAYIVAVAFVVSIFLLSRIMAESPLVTLSEALAASIIILSLVLLVGYAGEVSLATMAFAGIGGTVFFHHVGHEASSRAGLMAFVIAAVATALVGALIALPALRLRGLYLALATAAFSLAVEQMMFKEYVAQRRIYPATLILLIVVGIAAVFRGFSSYRTRGALIATIIAGAVIAVAATNPWLQHERWSPIFPNGDLQVPRPRLFGIDFDPQRNFLLLLAVVFAALGVFMIALRRSGYGRRLTAMKNSPAACATLGMNVVRLKLSVFMMSAAMAGLGGCLYAQQVGAVTADRFSLFSSMTMLMLLVVSGAGYVSGGLSAGLLYGAVFVALESTIAKVGDQYSAFHGTSAWLVHFTALLPALIGIGLGRNPSGFLSDAFARYRPMIAEVRSVLFAGIGVELFVWFLAFQHTINNWTFAVITLALAILLPNVAAAVKLSAYGRTARFGAEAGGETDDVPLELLGIDRAFTAEDLREIDRGIGLGVQVMTAAAVDRESLLVVEQVTVEFGGNRALSDVDLDARVGEITGLIGPNGAGKTTLFNVVTGLQSPTAGRIRFDGRDVSRLDTHRRARLGIARTFQRLELFTDLTVRDNLRVAGEIRNSWGGWARRFGSSGRIDVDRETERVLDLIGLNDIADADVSTVPTGTARVVELGRALMIQPRVLLLDEPASGQSDDETKAFEVLLRRLVRDDDLTILLVEHDMALVMDVCDRIHVLDFGEIIASGTPDEVRADPRVRDAYLGSGMS